MLVDPDVLRSLSGKATVAAEIITDTDLSAAVFAAADCMEHSSTQWAARLVSTHLGLRSDDLAGSAESMGRSVRGIGDAFEVDDNDLASDFERLWS